MKHGPTIKQLLKIRKIRVEAFPEQLLCNLDMLLETTKIRVGRYTARRDKPHYTGDEYHAHSEVPGGYEVSWGISGVRRHSNKFPAQVPRDAKLAVAKVLKISPELLESFALYDEEAKEWVYLIEAISGDE